MPTVCVFFNARIRAVVVPDAAALMKVRNLPDLLSVAQLLCLLARPLRLASYSLLQLEVAFRSLAALFYYLTLTRKHDSIVTAWIS